MAPALFSGELNLGSPPVAPGNTPIRIILTFGSRQVNVPGSFRMPVGELRDVAGSIADRSPGSLLLMHGDFTLQIGTVLGDYADFVVSSTFHVRVVIAPAASLSGPPFNP
jgi:hypothetical protein